LHYPIGEDDTDFDFCAATNRHTGSLSAKNEPSSPKSRILWVANEAGIVQADNVDIEKDDQSPFVRKTVECSIIKPPPFSHRLPRVDS
jgi:hypothetical protein